MIHIFVSVQLIFIDLIKKLFDTVPKVYYWSQNSASHSCLVQLHTSQTYSWRIHCILQSAVRWATVYVVFWLSLVPAGSFRDSTSN